jgi:hypothetical protein
MTGKENIFWLTMEKRSSLSRLKLFLDLEGVPRSHAAHLAGGRPVNCKARGIFFVLY